MADAGSGVGLLLSKVSNEQPVAMAETIQALNQQPGPGPRTSQRQASRGTFKRMLAQRQQEEQEYAEFERAAETRMRRGDRPAHPAQPQVPAPAAAAGCNVDADGVVVVVKKRRGRPPKPRPPETPKPHLMGPHLEGVLAQVRAAADSNKLAPGTPVWVKVTGYCAWPGLVWSLDLCARFTWPDVILTYEKGKVLVRFYGDHSSSWVADKQLLVWDDADVPHKSAALTAWGKKNNKLKLVNATLDELSARSDDHDEEMSRMDRLGRQYQLDYLQATARHRHSSLLRPHNSETGSVPGAEGEALGAEGGDGTPVPVVSVAAASAAVAAAAAAAGGDELPVTGNAWGSCDVCREEVPDMRCSSCHRWLHALCSSPAALTPTDYRHDQDWSCPCCGANNTVKVLPEEELLRQAAGQGVVAERMGLTPDWIISTTAFMVFQLPRPTADQPYIAGLLDPACNNKLEPNIPAEMLYDKRDDGLDPANSWKGYYVLLNPDYRAQVQWKFVNRAIDEVENGNVPAVLLVCRNSTDTAYFQRLRPYPRVLLRRCNTQFKDYDKCPIGFGVVVFCIATAAHHDCLQLYERFYKGFSPFGEPNIPIDTEFLSSPSFYQLLSRLRLHAEQHARDHWVQCSKCGVWRIISWQQQQALNSGATTEWTCNMLRPPLTSCATPQSKREITGVAAALDGPQHAPAAAGAPATPAGPSGHSLAAQTRTSSGSLGPDEDMLLLPEGEGTDLDRDPVQPSAEDTVQVVSADAGNCTPAPADATRCCSPEGSARGSNTPPAEAGLLAGDAAGAAALGAAAAAVAAKPADGPAALLALFEAQVTQLHTDLAAAYLCKAAAGQVTIQQAHEALAGSCGVLKPWGCAAAADPVPADARAVGGTSYIQRLAGVLSHQQQQQQLAKVEPAAGQQQRQQHLQQSDSMQVDLAQAPDPVPAVDVQSLRQHMLQTAAGRPVKRQRLSWGPTAHVSTGTGPDGINSMTVPDAGDMSGKLALNSLSPGLSLMAPMVLTLVRNWLLHLVQHLLLQHQKQAKRQQAQAKQQHKEGMEQEQVGDQHREQQGQQPAAAGTHFVQDSKHLSGIGPAVDCGSTGGADVVGCPKLAAECSDVQRATNTQQGHDQQPPPQQQGQLVAAEQQQQQQQQILAEEHMQHEQQVPLPVQLQEVPVEHQELALNQQQQQQEEQQEDSKCIAVGCDTECQLHADVESVPPPTAVLDREAAAASSAQLSSQCDAPALPAATNAAPTVAAAAASMPNTALVDPQAEVVGAAAAVTGFDMAPASAAVPTEHAPCQPCMSEPQATAKVCPELQAPLSPHTPAGPLGLVLQGAAAATAGPGGAPTALGLPVLPLPWGLPAQQLGQMGPSSVNVVKLAAVGAVGVAPAGLGFIGPVAGAVLARGSVGAASGVQGMQLSRGALVASPQQQQLLMMMQLQLLARCRAQGTGVGLGMQPTGLQPSSAAAAGVEHPAAVGAGFKGPASADAALIAAVTMPQPAAAAAAAAASQGRHEVANSAGDKGSSGIKVGAAGGVGTATAPSDRQGASCSQHAQAAEDVSLHNSASPALTGLLKPAAQPATEQLLPVRSVVKPNDSSAVGTAAGTALGPSTPPASRAPDTSAAAQGHSPANSTCPSLGPGGFPPVRASAIASRLGAASLVADVTAVDNTVGTGDDDGTMTGAALRAANKKSQPTNTARQVGLQAAANSDPADVDGSAGCSSEATATPLTGAAPVGGLRPRAVWGLTADPLLRAVLLEQPCLMEAVLTLLQDISAHRHSTHQLEDKQQAERPGSSGRSGAQRAPQDAGAAGGSSGQSPAGGSLQLCAEVDNNIIEALCSQPAVAGVGKWPARPLAQPQHQQEVADHGGGCEVDEYEGVEDVPDSTAEEVEMMSSLELARAARMAANKAYMLGLGLGQPASLMQQPSPAALEPNHAAVIAAARKLAQQAAVRRAKQQVDASQRLLDARRKARRQQEKRLRATLEALCADEAAAAKQVTDALRTLQDVQYEAFGE